MKKILTTGLLSGVLACSLFADAKDDAFLKFFNEILAGDAKAKILEINKISNSELKSYIVEISYNGETFKDMYFSDGVVFIEDNGGAVVDMKSKHSLKEEFIKKQKEAEQKKILPLLADFIKEGSPYMVKIGNDSKKPTMVVFSDPECPFCVKKLEHIEEDLKTNNVVYILTPVHGKSAYEKVLNILEEAKNARTDSAKIAAIKKYYNPNIKSWKTYNDDEFKKAYIDITNIMRKFKIQATPTIIENVPVK